MVPCPPAMAVLKGYSKFRRCLPCGSVPSFLHAVYPATVAQVLVEGWHGVLGHHARILLPSHYKSLMEVSVTPREPSMASLEP
eukprot:1160269-Pelagomonas_calceolata.AAC.2